MGKYKRVTVRKLVEEPRTIRGEIEVSGIPRNIKAFPWTAEAQTLFRVLGGSGEELFPPKRTLSLCSKRSNNRFE